MVEILSNEFLTKLGFNEGQAGQVRELWDTAVENISRHGTLLAAKIGGSLVGAIIIDKGAGLAQDIGRLLDPRKYGGYDSIINFLSIFGGRPNLQLPPPEAALFYTGADFLRLTADLLPYAVATCALYQHGKPLMKGFLDEGNLLFTLFHATGIEKEAAGRELSPQFLEAIMKVQSELTVETGKQVLANTARRALTRPSDSDPES